MTLQIGEEPPDSDEELAERIVHHTDRLNQAIDDARTAGLTVEVDEFDGLVVEVSRRKRIARTHCKALDIPGFPILDIP